MSGTKLLSGLVIVVISIWVTSLMAIMHFLPSWSERGQFGDLFGSVNSLFSGLAFAGLITTILLQREELQLQREELKLQREEMANSRAELAKQAQAQQLLFYATVGQIRVAAMQARIEAIKMESEQLQPSFRDKQISDIKSEADSMSEYANTLEDIVLRPPSKIT